MMLVFASIPSDKDFPILQYADDTLIFMKGDISELMHLRGCCRASQSLLVKVDFDKSMRIPLT